ncbi:SusC/RagA family TonB-linked outer membrane protein [Dysgonomonas sp. GY617]|uniref:SusC/RagA family TonB-linked outer membrane protein n=1 Tax=Dysgonomonas sp. GY617 TaxID=2780420 RepID=UPI001883B0A5|nr:TonB-dependent receptor [Dysgonomonas sp. GY617]MBF0576750.1 TonB-dependent receptor [Dysgonomonas sp. GY617]
MHVHKKYFLRLCWLGTLCLISGSNVLFPLSAEEHISNTTSISQQATKRKITGIVTDQSGPLVGVTVTVKGSTIGTVTDLEGVFSLDVENGQTIDISYLGYVPQSIRITNQTNLNVALKENAAVLDEVVVVGYGTQKKSDITGAMVNVKEDIIRQAPVANVASALQGLAAGVQVQMEGGDTRPGAVPKIRVRGERSIKADNDALIVVDGIPFAGSLNDINNDDIQSVSVLKDASSTAIYGSRGANGVVLITTKRGSKGKIQVSYNGFYGVTSAIKNFDVMNSDQFIRLKQWSQYNANPDKYTGVDDPELMKIGVVFRDQDEMDGFNAGNNTDWQDLIFKNGIRTSHQISLNGGSEKTSYNASVGYFKGENNYRGHSFERMTAKFSLDTEVSRILRVGLSSLNTFTKTKGEDVNPMDQALRASPFTTPYNDDGSLRTYLPGSGQNVWNPLLDEQEGAVVDDRKTLSTFTSGYLELTLPEGFKYRFNGGIQLRQNNRGEFLASNTTRRMGALNKAFSQNEFIQDYTVENILTWDRTINKVHNISFTGLFSYEDRILERNSIESFDYYDDNVQHHNPGKAQGAITGGGTFDKWSILSYMGRLNYNFKERYLFTATVRYDGSSRLAEGNKWHAFPSLALGWNVIQESFMQEVGFLSGLKLRASWGNVGSTAIDPYQTMARLSDNKYLFGTAGVMGVYPGSVPDKSLGWENTETYNIGIDFGFLSNRINGTLELYQQNTTDLLLPVKLPATSGYSSSYLTNLGATRNRGVEFNVSTVNINGDGQNKLLWTTDFNIFANRNKVVDLGEGVTQIPDENLYLGRDRWAILSLEADGIWQDTPEDRALAETFGYKVSGPTSVIGNVKVKNHHVDYEDDGVTPKAEQKINDDDRVFIGRRAPNFEGGINNRFALKGFDLAFLFTFREGGTLTSDMHNSWMNEMKGSYNNLNVDYWTPDNTSARWPKPSAAEVPNKGLLARYSASYLKLRNITIGYTVPKNLSTRYGIQSARVYATASNLYTWFDSQYKKDGGIDPETTSTINLTTPPTRAFVFGLNLSF